MTGEAAFEMPGEHLVPVGSGDPRELRMAGGLVGEKNYDVGQNQRDCNDGEGAGGDIISEGNQRLSPNMEF